MPLPGGVHWRGLRADGTLGPPATAVELCAGEAAILMKADLLRVPARPWNLRAAQEGASIMPDWIDYAATETGFTIQRKDGGGEWRTVATVGPDTTGWKDASAPSGAVYRVRADCRLGDSDWSNEAIPTDVRQ